MRVLIIHDPYGNIEKGNIGGEDNLVHREILALRSIGIDVFTLTISCMGFRRKYNQLRAQLFGSNPSVLKIIDKYKPDIILCHNMQQSTGYRWMKKIKVPVVMSLHNFRLFCSISTAWRDNKVCTECSNGDFYKVFKYNCGNFKSKINALRKIISHQPERTIPTLYLSSSNLLKKAHFNFVNPSKFFTLGSLPDYMKPETSIPKNSRNNFIFAGRLEPEKGILELIEIWPNNYNLHIYGNGSLVEILKKQIESKPNIKLHPPFSPNNSTTLSSYLGLIFPSLWLEGSPLIVMEALANGTPIISSKSNGAVETILDAEAGIILEEFSTRELNLAIEDLITNFELYSTRALRYSNTNLDYQVWARKLSNMFDSVIKSVN